MSEDKGTYLRYVDKKFTTSSMTTIENCNKIIHEYEARGLVLTLRQLFYQNVARGLIPNTQASYNNLGNIISDARLAGLVSWAAIEDRTRFLRGVQTYDNPAQLLEQAKESYAIDMWYNQPMRPEVWIEKDALVGVIEQVCTQFRVDYFACKGYNSQSEQWRAGQRLAGYIKQGQRPIIFHLGDHDPSGLDMTRDNRERLSMFAGTPIQVVRLALNMDQIEQYNPPPNPVKSTDSRRHEYQDLYGDECWELDALDPLVLYNLIRDAILRVRSGPKWDEALFEEADDQRYLQELVEEANGTGAA